MWAFYIFLTTPNEIMPVIDISLLQYVYTEIGKMISCHNTTLPHFFI